MYSLLEGLQFLSSPAGPFSSQAQSLSFSFLSLSISSKSVSIGGDRGERKRKRERRLGLRMDQWKTAQWEKERTTTARETNLILGTWLKRLFKKKLACYTCGLSEYIQMEQKKEESKTDAHISICACICGEIRTSFYEEILHCLPDEEEEEKQLKEIKLVDERKREKGERRLWKEGRKIDTCMYGTLSFLYVFALLSPVCSYVRTDTFFPRNCLL